MKMRSPYFVRRWLGVHDAHEKNMLRLKIWMRLGGSPGKKSSQRCRTALPTVSSTVLLGMLAVLYGPMRGLVLTVVLVKDSRTEQYSSTAARAIY
jgi:hypothetical protein